MAKFYAKYLLTYLQVEVTSSITTLNNPGIKISPYKNLNLLYLIYRYTYMRCFLCQTTGMKASLAVQQGRLVIIFFLGAASQQWH